MCILHLALEALDKGNCSLRFFLMVSVRDLVSSTGKFSSRNYLISIYVAAWLDDHELPFSYRTYLGLSALIHLHLSTLTAASHRERVWVIDPLRVHVKRSPAKLGSTGKVCRCCDSYGNCTNNTHHIRWDSCDVFCPPVPMLVLRVGITEA